MAGKILPRGDWKGYEADKGGTFTEYRSKTFGVAIRKYPSTRNSKWIAHPKQEGTVVVQFSTAFEAIIECENPQKKQVAGVAFDHGECRWPMPVQNKGHKS